MRTRPWPYTLAVVILILLSTTGELTLFHTLCAGAGRIRRQLYESNGEKEYREEDKDVGRRYKNR